MFLGAGRFQLCPKLTGEDVVADQVVFAVMLVESGAFAGVDQVVGHRDARRTFVGVKPPASVIA